MIEFDEFETHALEEYKDNYYPIEFYMRNLFMETFNVKIDPSKVSMIRKIVIFDFGSFEIWGLPSMKFYFSMKDEIIFHNEVKTIQDIGRFVFKYVKGGVV